MRDSSPNVGASVRARLLNLARERREDFQLVLLRYGNERLLYRLSQSEHGESFVLKGAALFPLWTERPSRATRDLDLLGYGEPAEERLRKVFEEVLREEVQDDGLEFDVQSLEVGQIRAETRYGGIRLKVMATLAKAKVRLQIDVGFGDAVTPEPQAVVYPTLLDFPAPRLKAYPRETVVAEKLEAMVQLGMANTRMKDFYDLLTLARELDFRGEVLLRAIQNTFSRRGTVIPSERPVALKREFFEDGLKQTQWKGFVRKAAAADAPELGDAMALVAAFVLEPLGAAAAGVEFGKRWEAPGPWQ